MFTLPSFLQSQDADSIHRRMLEALPDDMDKGEGGFPWDFTRPTANEKALMAEYTMAQAVRNLFPQWADAPWLDYHGENRGIVRKPAQRARVELLLSGVPGTVAPKGFICATQATLESDSQQFALEEQAVIGEDGTAPVMAAAVEAGRVGNVPAGAVALQLRPLAGLTGVINPQAAGGGFEEESDVSLRERIAAYDQTQGVSFVGSASDYMRWAQATPGVGNAKVLPATDGSGMVTIIVTDLDGNPASEPICRAVEQTILRPDDPSARLAPINARLHVTPPKTLAVAVAARVRLEEGYGLEGVAEAFGQGLIAYFKTEEAQQQAVYTRIGAILSRTAGVEDYAELTVNGGTANLAVAQEEMPVVGSVELT